MFYEVALLNKRIYSVTFTGEGCGAYCESFEYTYNFDLQTGEPLQLEWLFTERGQVRLLVALGQQKGYVLNQKVEEIERFLNTDTLSADRREYYLKMRELYTTCNPEIDQLNYVRWIPGRDGLTIISGCCSAHVNRALDEIGEFEYGCSYQEWNPMLSEYGKEILNLNFTKE